jgi:uncharacterized membrane protein (UPF0127 family)
MPEQVLVQNLSRPNIHPIQARFCSSFACRLRGLTFRRNLPSGEGLLLVQGRDSRMDASIHMLFVWIDLAVVWISTAQQVVDVRLARRWRPAYLPARPARYVLEISPERLEDFYIGDQLHFESKVFT